MNILIASGNLGGDPETRFAQSGTAVSTFSLPVRQGWGDNEKTTWVECTVFGKKGTGEPHGLIQYLKKGQLVTVSGEIVLDQWEHEGQKYYKLKCLVKEIVAPKTDGATKKPEPKKPDPEPAQVELEEDDIPFSVEAA